MKIIVDEMPKVPKDCPYSIEKYGMYWCNYRRDDSRVECNDACECNWFTEVKGENNAK